MKYPAIQNALEGYLQDCCDSKTEEREIQAEWDSILAAWETREFFPHMDYDNGPLFNETGRFLSRFGFTDSTWGNDTCPSVYYETDPTQEFACHVFVDYADPELREIQGPMLIVNFYVDGSLDKSKCFDKLSEVVAYLINEGVL